MPGDRSLSWGLVAAWLLAALACSSAPESDPYAPVVVPIQHGADPGPGAGLGDPHRFEVLLAQAEEARDAGRHRDALRVLQLALDARPPDPLRRELLRLRRDIKKELLREGIVAGTLRTGSGRYILGDKVPIEVRLTNLGDEELTIPVRHPAPAAGRRVRESASAFVLRIQYREWDYLGSTVEQDKPWIVEIRKDIRIAPGSRWSRILELDTRDPFFRPGLVVYRRLRIDGELRPVEIRAGELSWFAPVRLEAAAFEIFPPGIEGVAANPASTLSRAIRIARESPRALNHVFFASILLFQRRPQSALQSLVGVLDDPAPALRRTALASLHLLSGRDDLESHGEWQEYLSTRFP